MDLSTIRLVHGGRAPSGIPVSEETAGSIRTASKCATTRCVNTNSLASGFGDSDGGIGVGVGSGGSGVGGDGGGGGSSATSTALRTRSKSLANLPTPHVHPSQPFIRREHGV